MPTGYTAKLMEEGQTFKQFALTCARAFGACMMLRDEPLDKPIPDSFEPSDYYSKELKIRREKLLKLQCMSGEEITKFGEKAKKEALESDKKWLAKDTAENKRLEEMEQEVLAWIPPTSEHKGMKEFMLEQIQISKHDLGYITDRIESNTAKTPAMFYYEAVSEAQRSLDFYTDEQGKEIERTNGWTEWIQQLKKSLGVYDH